VPCEVHNTDTSYIGSRKEIGVHCEFHLRIGERERRSSDENLGELHFDVCEGIRFVFETWKLGLISRRKQQKRRDSTREECNGADYVLEVIFDGLTWLLSELLFLF